jgi:hypothetical protein
MDWRSWIFSLLKQSKQLKTFQSKQEMRLEWVEFIFSPSFKFIIFFRIIKKRRGALVLVWSHPLSLLFCIELNEDFRILQLLLAFSPFKLLFCFVWIDVNSKMFTWLYLFSKWPGYKVDFNFTMSGRFSSSNITISI